MNIQNTLDLIPTDLLYEIFSRLPAKSVGRCRCVSKKLASILGSEGFKMLFFTRSLTRPRLLFAIRHKENWVFYSSPQPQNPYEKSSLVVRADFHTKFPNLNGFYLSYASGLFDFSDFEISTDNTSDVICNPITGQHVILPKLRTDIVFARRFLGFDPIDKQFKLLVMDAQANRVNNERIHFILTLGTGKMKWRTIQCPLLRDDYPYIWNNGICINGVLYCLGSDIGSSYVIICFDVRTETFKFKFFVIEFDDRPQLINYRGKLGITFLRRREWYSNNFDLYMWVLEEDVEKQELSKYFYTLPTKNYINGLYVVGMTSTDEIVLSTVYKPSYLYYFNLENNSLQNVEVQGLENYDYGHVIMDYVEDLHLNDEV